MKNALNIISANMSAAIEDKAVRMIMDHAPFCVWCKDYTDDSGTAIYGNQNFARLYGFNLEDWIGRTDYDTFPEATARLWEKSDRTALLHGTYLQYQNNVAIKNGEIIKAVVYKWRVNAGDKIFVAGFTLPEDINEQ